MIVEREIYDRIKEKKRKLDSLRPLPKAVLKKMKEQFAIELAYNSNAIEGNSLTLKETRLVIEEGVTIRGKPLREHFEAINHDKAFGFLESLVSNKVKITENVIKEIHKIILSGIDDKYAGRYRDVNVRILGAIKSPPRFGKVPGEMTAFLREFDENPKGFNDVELDGQIISQVQYAQTNQFAFLEIPDIGPVLADELGQFLVNTFELTRIV